LWAFGQFRIAEEMLAHPPERAPGCRRALAKELARAYGGSTGHFAAAWGATVPGFDALERVVLSHPANLPARAREDLAAFSRRMVDAYVRIPSQACREAAPHHLNLGMRWAWISSDDLLAGSDA
jgi:hypothetical protein